MDDMLEHDAFDSGGLELAEAGDEFVGGACETTAAKFAEPAVG